ncbi:MAG: NADH:ubiquinone oxidoreductase [Planctomycetota bacterium]
MSNGKPRVAIFDFACCEGCELQIVNLEEVLVDLLSVVDVVSFREAMKEHSDDYDIAIIDGSITMPSDEARIKDIRAKAKILIAIGACACTGGVNAMKNRFTMDEVKRIVYGKDGDGIETYPARPVSAVVKVDAAVPGCPINRTEFLNTLKALLQGKTPRLPSYSVCVECKLNENLCVYDLGQLCLGPITRAGCNSWCPNFRDACEGCRGLVENPNLNAAHDVLAEHGLTVEDIQRKFSRFLNYKPADIQK